MYGKKEATMTRGVAILSMLVLHLFCRKGADVYGTPLIWINETTPLVYYFGFFSNICVPLYSLCAGYAQCFLWKKAQVKKLSTREQWRNNLKRILRLLINYWIVLALFSVLGSVLPSDGSMPGSITEFLESIVLLHSYNGAWWFLNTYIILLLIPPTVLMLPTRKLNTTTGLFGCLFIQVAYYLVGRFGIWPDDLFTQASLSRVWTEVDNLICVLPYFYAGVFLCDGNVVDKVSRLFNNYVHKHQRFVLLLLFSGLFVVVSMLEKAVLMPTVAVIVFLLFNLWEKGKVMERVFCFMGKHSTNIWLSHMFFYACVFPGLAQRAQYPLLIFAFLLGLCICTSFVIFKIQEVGSHILKLSVDKRRL